MGKTRILLVENEPMQAKSIGLKLEKLGYQIAAHAQDGHEAVKLAAKILPDIIIMDIELSADIDGIEAVEKIQNNFDIPIIYLTAFSDDITVQRIKKTLPFGYLIKPFDDKDLETAIQISLYKYQADKKIKENEKKYRNLFELSPIGIITVDLKGIITSCNIAIESLTGYSKDEIIGKNFVSLPSLYKSDTPAYLKIFQDIINGNIHQNYEFKWMNKNGELKYGNANFGYLEENDKIIGIQVLLEDFTDRKLADKALHESEEQYRLVVENALEAIFIAQDGFIKFPNKAVENITGYSFDELLSIPFVEIIHPGDKELVAERHQRRLYGEEIPDRYSFRILTKTNETKWVEINAVVVDWAGRPATLNFISDITERINTENHLKKSEEFNRRLVESAPIGIMYIDKDMVFTYENSVMKKMMGVPKNETSPIIGMKVSEIPNISDTLKAELLPVILSGKIVDGIILHYKSMMGIESDLEVTLAPIISNNGNFEGAIFLASDITEKLANEKVLKESEERFRTIFEKSPIAIEYYDKDGNIIEVNPAARKLFGVKSNEGFGNFNFFESPQVADDIKQCSREGKTVRYEKWVDFEKVKNDNLYQTERKDKIYVDTISTPIFIEGDEKPSGYIVQIQDFTEEKFAEEALKESENRLSLALEGANIGLWDQNFRTNKVYRSKEWAQMLGYDLKEIGNDLDVWTKLIHPDDLPSVVESTKLHEKGMTPVYKEMHRMKCKDGSYKWILNWGKISEWDENGKPIRAIGIHMDMTDRVQAEVELRESKERFELAMLASNDGLFDWNMITDEVYYSPGWKRMLGYAESELENKLSTWGKMTDPQDVQRTMKLIQSHIAGEVDRVEIEFKMKHKDGHLVDILSRGNVILDENGKAVRMVGTHVDISEIKRKENELKLLSDDLNKAQNVAHVGNWRWDIKNNKVTWSDEMKKIWGFEPDKLKGDLNEIIQNSIHPDDQEIVNKSNESVLKKKIPIPVEYRIIRPDKSIRYIWAEAGELFYDEDENPTVLTGIVQDITERKEAEIKIKTANNNLTLAQEMAKVGYWSYDLINQIPSWSDQMFKIFDIDKEQGEPTYDEHKKYIHPDDWETFDTSVNLLIQTGEEYNLELRVIQRDKSIIYIRTHGEAQYDENNKLVNLLGVTQDITDQKEAQKALEASEQFLNETGRMARVGGWEVNLDTDTVYWTETTKIIHEVPLDYVPTLEEAIKFFPGSSEKIISEAVKNAIEKGESYDLELEFITAKGNKLWTHTMGSPIMENGRCARLYGTFQDITKIKEAELAIKESEEKFKSIFNHAPEGIYIVDENGNYLDSNPAGYHLLGYTYDEMIRMSITDVIPEKDLEKGLAHFKKAVDTGTSIGESGYMKKSGEEGTWIVNATKLSENRFLGMVKDITQIRRSEIELNEKMNELQRFNRVMVGRENKMIELKKEVNDLCEKLSLPRKYNAPNEI